MDREAIRDFADIIASAIERKGGPSALEEALGTTPTTLVAIAVARLAAVTGRPLFHAGAACGLVVMSMTVRGAFTDTWSTG